MTDFKKQLEDSMLQRSDIKTIIDVNNKAIELQTEISSQYEDILGSNAQILKIIEKMTMNQEYVESDLREAIKDIKKEIKEINGNQGKIMILLSSGILSVVAQIITTLVHK